METFIIAEIGINHNGDIEKALKLIDIAYLAGCSAVKFQKRNPDICVPEHQKDVIKQTPWGEMTYLKYKKRMEFGDDQYDIIDEYCRHRDIMWSASPWDLDSLKFLKQYNVPFLKIPSAMLTNESLVRSAAKFDKKVILSTGMSTIQEIDKTVSWLREENANFALLHCNSTYPAPLKDLNLKCIQTLKKRYNCEVGYSGHEFRLGTSVSAVYLGATIIERHITLDRTLWGTDQLCSVEPQGLIKLVKGIRELELALGNGIKVITKEEEIIRNKLRG